MKVYTISRYDIVFATKELAEEYIRVGELVDDTGDYTSPCEVYEMDFIDNPPTITQTIRIHGSVVESSRKADTKYLYIRGCRSNTFIKELYGEEYFIGRCSWGVTLTGGGRFKQLSHDEDGYFYKEHHRDFWVEELTLQKLMQRIIDYMKENNINELHISENVREKDTLVDIVLNSYPQISIIVTQAEKGDIIPC